MLKIYKAMIKYLGKLKIKIVYLMCMIIILKFNITKVPVLNIKKHSKHKAQENQTNKMGQAVQQKIQLM